MEATTTNVKNAAIKVLAEQRAELDELAIRCLEALPGACDQAQRDYDNGAYHAIGKPGTPSVGPIRSAIVSELAKAARIPLTLSSRFIDDVLYNAQDEEA